MDQSHSNTIETSLNYLYMLMKVLVSLGIIGVFGHYCVLLAGLALKNVPKYRKEMLQGAK